MIPVNAPLLDGNEKQYLMECIDTGWISSEGPFVKLFESRFSARLGRKHGIAVANGSVALDAALIALGLENGDEVIMPTFTIISCAAAIVRAGAVPVLVDSQPDTFNMDVDRIEAKITPRTRAIMVVHIYGLPVAMDRVLALAEEYGLKIVEDAAEQYGQFYKQTAVGGFGDISCVSFYPNKHVTTGEGGMILTDDDELAARCRSLRDLCFTAQRRFCHDDLGYNFRMSNLQAAVGVAQLEQIDRSIEKKRWMGRTYNQALESLTDKLELPTPKTDYAENIYWVYTLVLKNTVEYEADELIRRLGERKIGARPFFWCMHEQPVFLKRGLFRNETYPVAERMARRGLYIPSGVAITENQISVVAAALHEILQ